MLQTLNRWKFLVCAAFVALAVTACGDGEGEEDSCVTSADCPEGQRCGSNGQCTTETQSCTTSSDCAPDEFCQPADGVCQARACAEDTECGDGAVCAGEICRPGCRADADCGDGFRCTSTNVCEAEGCTTGSCGDFQFCNEDLDPPTCEFNGDCDCGTPPDGVSDQEWCETQPGGNPVCAFYAQQEEFEAEYICSNAANECVEKPPCVDDRDCPENEICEPDGPAGKKVCRPGCRDDDGCPPFSICVEAAGNVCRPGCSGDSDCNMDQTCVDFVCVDTCTTRQDCSVVGQVCTGIPPTCRGCTNDNQCAAVEFCDYSLGSDQEEIDDPLTGLCAPIVTCPDDGYGNNDNADNAFGIMTPFDATGDSSPAFCTENPNGDWYELNTSNGDVVEITLNYDERRGNLDVALLQSNGQQLVASARPPQDDGGTEQLVYGVPLGQPLLIQVRGSIVEDFIEYDLTVDVGPAAACTDDGYEPNQDTDNATPLPLDMMTGVGEYNGLQVCGDDRDFYELCADANQVVQVDVTADPRFGNVDFIIRDSGGSVLGNGDTLEETERLEVLTTNPECLTVEVYPATGVGVIDYDFRWTQRPNVCTDQFEQNDVCPQQVTNLAPGSYTDLAICSDPDFYCFTVLPLQTIDFQACYDANVAGDLDVTLFGPNDCAAFLQTEVRQAGTAPNEVCETINFQANDAGEYCIQGSLFSGLNVPYRIDFDLIDGPACANDSNANNTPQDAVTFDPALAATGSDNVVGGRICDLEDDWFAIDLAEGDTVLFDVRHTFSNGNLDAFLYGPNDSTLLLDSGETTTDDDQVTYTVGTGEAGTYYLRVTGTPAARNDYTVILELNGTGPPDPDCPDALENNDDRANASPVVSGDSFSGLSVCGLQRDDDWFTTDLSAGETITIDLTYNTSDGNVDLFFFDDRATTIATASSTQSTGTEQVVYTTARDQTVAWRVQTSAGTAVSTYSLSTTITPAPPCNDDANEDNDTPSTATPIMLDAIYGSQQKCENDEDWYAFTVPAGSTAEIFANFSHSQADLNLELYDSTGTNLIDSASTTSDDESLNIAAPASDTDYLVKVVTASVARIRYDLLTYIDGQGPADRQCPDAFEQNDFRSSAAALPVGLSSDLLLCWEGGALNDRDWYEITVPGNATVTVDVLFNHGLGNIDAALYQEGVVQPVATGVTTTDNEQLVATNPNPTPTTFSLEIDSSSTIVRFTNAYELDVSLAYPGNCSMLDDAVTAASLTDADTAGETPVGNFPALTLCENTEDWVKLPGGITSVEAHIEYAAALGNIDMELIEWDGANQVVVASAAELTNVEDIVVSGLDSSRSHFLRIYPTQFTRTDYDLWFATNADTPTVDYCPDVYERNDTIDLAAALTGSVTVRQNTQPIACGLDDDYYRFTPSRNVQNYFAVFANSPDDQDLSVEIFDPSNTSIASQDANTDGDEVLTYTTTTFGEHRFRVSNSGNSGAGYDLLHGPASMYTVAGCPEDQYESNDSISLTIPLMLPFNEGLGRCDDDDYFTITPTTADPVTVEARYDGANLNLTITVDEGFTRIGGAFKSGNRTTFTFTPTPNTTYIIGVTGGRVAPTDPGAASGPYFLHINQ
jgi:hypothetical protein